MPFSAFSQDFIQKVALEICNCVDTIENIDSLEAKLNRCAFEAFETVLENSTEEVQEAYSTGEAVDETINKAFEELAGECPKIRKYILDDRKTAFYKMSDSEAANKYYEDGNTAFSKKEIKGAIKLFRKAVKEDKSFVYALDNLGLAYRQSGDNKKAVKYYIKSLEVYPEGNFALQNLGVAYTYLNEMEKAVDTYRRLNFFYPDDPEAYFGIGRVLVLAGKYEDAIDYVFIAHKIYSSTNSDYIKDSEELALSIYNALKEQKKEDIFIQKAKEYGISIN
jgi:tetratricopeptide (TPR) repeat protein